MKPDPTDRIPIPARHRWREVRMRVLPVVVFVAAIGAIAVLWRGHVGAPTLIGQAEPTLASVSSHKPGMLVELSVTRFQRVRAGDPIGRVTIADPRVIAATLDVIRAEIEQLRIDVKPLLDRQRNVMDYAQLRLDWMRQRAQLASAQAAFQFAESELYRTEGLFKEKITSQRSLDLARTTHDGARQQVEELTRLVTECEQSLVTLNPTNITNLTNVAGDPMRAAMAVQEARLRQAEAELEPIVLRVPLDGVVTAVHRRAGESIIAGEPILTVASQAPARLVSYLRAPDLDTAKVGMKVQVRSRNSRREIGLAQITEVGTQLETPPLALASPVNPAADLALPLEISLPANFNLHPGELVDIIFVSE